MLEIALESSANKEMIDITMQVERKLREEALENGVLTLFVPHTTAALTINENADPDVQKDILGYIQKLVPKNSGFSHAEGNSDAHILTSFFGSSLQVIVENGSLILGTWQSIFFCEFDGPRKRKVFFEFISK